MARTAEQILREIVSDLTFKVATLLAQVEELQEKLKEKES